MSSMPLAPEQHPRYQNRRSHQRLRFGRITYAKFGPDNGGILINLSEGGFSFQGVGQVNKHALIQVSFKLPGSNTQIEASGTLVWSNESGKGGGVRFTDLTVETQQKLKIWFSNGTLLADLPANRTMADSMVARGPGQAEGRGGQSGPRVYPGQPKPAATPSVHEPEQIPGSDLVSGVPAASPFEPDTSTRSPRSLDFMFEADEAPIQKFPKPVFVGFCMGLLFGGAIVLAGVVGVMIGRSSRPVIPEKAALSAEQTASAAPNSENDEAAPQNDEMVSQTDNRGADLISKSDNVDQDPAVEPLPVSKPSRSKTEASELPTAYGRNGEPRHDSQRSVKVARPVMALLAPHPATTPSRSEPQKDSTDDNVPPAVMTATQLATTVSNIPALPRPVQPPSESPNRNMNYLEPTLIQRSEPFYPPDLRKRHVEGVLKFNATIGTDGVPRGLQLVSGDSRLAQAAQDAISQWRYIPAVSGGSPVESNIVIVINFQSQP